MKIKQILTQICIGLLVLITVKSLVGGFEFTKAGSHVLLFILLYSFAAWLTTRIQVFFLLPRMVIFMSVLHTGVLYLLFYVSIHYIGGIKLALINQSFLNVFGDSLTKQSLGEFGTIGLVSFLTGSIYQLIIWLNNEK